jgi:flagellar assembly protein FliH
MAAIIKSTRRSTSAAEPAAQAFQFDDMERAYVGHVRTEAAKIIAEARREAAQIKVRAAEEGKQAAFAAVEAAVRARLDQQLHSAIAAIRQTAVQISESRQAWQQHWQAHAVALAVAIAARICRRQIEQNPKITLAWIREALELATGSEQVTLRLNPDDLAVLAGQIDELSRDLKGVGAIRVVADPAVTAGGCRVETEFGSLDQQIETQLNRIREELLA